ncbi:MAG: hypothetical protein JWL90_1814 [Chthoniobacteraceae bacterium]|nr:hypothetical protein [Chthoniobacteraceae bacterium]
MSCKVAVGKISECFKTGMNYQPDYPFKPLPNARNALNRSGGPIEARRIRTHKYFARYLPNSIKETP